MTATALLRRAADGLRAGTIAWGKEEYLNRRTGCRCALGAITWAADPDDKDGDPRFAVGAMDATQVLADYLVLELGATPCGDPSDDGGLRPDVVEIVGGWNDEDGRTVHEVIVALDMAAAWSEQRQAVTA